jgi:hypothetical protein
MFCTNCGAMNEDAVRFCYKCDNAIRVPSQTENKPNPGATVATHKGEVSAPRVAAVSSVLPAADPSARAAVNTAPAPSGHPEPKASFKAASPPTPETEARQDVQSSVIMLGLLAAVYLYGLFAFNDAGMRFGAAIGIVVSLLVAWGLWAKNSVLAGFVALVLFWVQGLGLIGAVGGNMKIIGQYPSLGLVVVLCFYGGYKTFKATREMKKLAASK